MAAVNKVHRYKMCLACHGKHIDIQPALRLQYPLHYSYCPHCAGQLAIREVEHVAKPKKYFKIPIDKITDYSMTVQRDVHDAFSQVYLQGPAEYIHTIEVKSLDTKMVFNKNDQVFHTKDIVRRIQI